MNLNQLKLTRCSLFKGDSRFLLKEEKTQEFYLIGLFLFVIINPYSYQLIYTSI